MSSSDFKLASIQSEAEFRDILEHMQDNGFDEVYRVGVSHGEAWAEEVREARLNEEYEEGIEEGMRNISTEFLSILGNYVDWNSISLIDRTLLQRMLPDSTRLGI